MKNKPTVMRASPEEDMAIAVLVTAIAYTDALAQAISITAAICQKRGKLNGRFTHDVEEIKTEFANLATQDFWQDSGLKRLNLGVQDFDLIRKILRDYPASIH